MKNLILSAFLLAALPLTPVRAEVTLPGENKSKPTLSEITNKFVRNMKLIRQLTPEPEITKQMDIVIEQADGIVKLYSENGAGRKREELLRQVKDLEAAKNVNKRDLEKIDKLKEEIQGLDGGNMFNKSTQYLNAAISDLRTLLDQVYSQDSDRNELLRITKMHLEVYQFSYRELMK